LPEDALAYAAKIVKNQLTIFINFDELEVDEEPESEEKQEIKGTEEILFNTIEEMDLSARSLNCLRKAGIEYAGDLIQKSEEDLLNLENFGKRSLFEIREMLEEMGLGLGLAIDQDVFDAEKAKRSEKLVSQ
jgi:DNA-directed RNA polymerase subunit alpha